MAYKTKFSPTLLFPGMGGGGNDDNPELTNEHDPGNVTNGAGNSSKGAFSPDSIYDYVYEDNPTINIPDTSTPEQDTPTTEQVVSE